MAISYKKEYEIHYYDVDSKLDSKISTIMDFFSDIGNKQSESLGVGLDYLMEENLAWVFYQYRININRFPKYGEKITVTTCGKCFRKFYASRVYDICNEEGEKLVEAEAIFVLLDLEKRRAIRIPDDQYEAYKVSKEEYNRIQLIKLPRACKEDFESCYTVRYSDIDSNKHVNNVKYVDWALDSLPLEIREKSLKSIDIIFEKECYYKEDVKVTSEIESKSEEEIIIIHKIENEEGKELTLLRTVWENK